MARPTKKDNERWVQDPFSLSRTDVSRIYGDGFTARVKTHMHKRKMSGTAQIIITLPIGDTWHGRRVSDEIYNLIAPHRAHLIRQTRAKPKAAAGSATTKRSRPVKATT